MFNVTKFVGPTLAIFIYSFPLKKGRIIEVRRKSLFCVQFFIFHDLNMLYVSHVICNDLALPLISFFGYI